MGLAGPKTRRKLQLDPNNTKWSRDETTFGQKILRAQGWEPGKFLGVQDSSHSHLHTAASSAPIKVTLKDDTLGLGAKIRQKQSAECTGLDGFKDLLGRLNGKSEETIEKEKEVRSSIKTSLYAERRYGPMRFVSGGLLIGDQMQKSISTDTEIPKSEKTKDEKPDTILEDIPVFSEKKQKKEKKSKKRKTEESDSINDTDGVHEKKKKKRSKDEGSQDDLADSEVKKSSKKSKKSKREDEETDQTKSERKKKDKKLREENAEDSLESKKERKERRKKEKKARKEKKSDTADSSTEIAVSTSISTSVLAATPQDSGVSTPTGTGTSTPQAFSARHLARSRNIASKRMAMADLQALNQIFMVKPV